LDSDCNIRIVSADYNQGAATGILATSTADNNIRATGVMGMHPILFDASVTLEADTWYRLIVEPVAATNTTLHDATVSEIGKLDFFGGGRDWHLTTAKDPTGDGSWTNYNSGTFRRPFMGLIVDGLLTQGTPEVPSGGGFTPIAMLGQRGVGIS
jgi:hypothetical protein